MSETTENRPFNWKSMTKFLLQSGDVELERELYKGLQKDPILYPVGNRPTHDEATQISVRNSFKLCELRKLFSDRITFTALFKLTSHVSVGAGMQDGISSALFVGALNSVGTDRHLKYVELEKRGEIIGAYCLTEIGHGSDTRSMRTEAVYDKESRGFVLNTPNFEAAKCWSGNVGRIATHAVVYAQLIIPDDGNYGLQPFVVQIRDTRTLLPRPGVTIAHLGEKVGLNGVDNGVIIFNNFRIPKENLLNRLGDINDEGNYVLEVADTRKQYAIALSVLFGARISVVILTVANLTHALVIAVRCLFNQNRTGHPRIRTLMPHLAIAYVGTIFSPLVLQLRTQLANVLEKDDDSSTKMLSEMHAIATAAKSIFSWQSRDGVKECVEACSSLAYYRDSDLVRLKSDNEANCTYDGENHVLIQQTSNWLMKLWPEVAKGTIVDFPLGSVSFLNKEVLNTTFHVSNMQQFMDLNNILGYYRWLITYLLKKSHDKHVRLLENDQFSRKNENQVYYRKSLSVAYFEHFTIQIVSLKVKEAADDEIRTVLTKLLSLYGIWNLQKFVPYFYEGGYVHGSLFAEYIEDSILLLNHELEKDALSLVNAIASPDVFGWSAVGYSGGQIYERLESAILQQLGVFSTPAWISAIKNLKSKL
uniref:Acyl-coenzyme A oxidase n=2 Tax=Photinus pyralis TaxID=7054 RepID=A0A1Y1KJK9_PHOPY